MTPHITVIVDPSVMEEKLKAVTIARNIRFGVIDAGTKIRRGVDGVALTAEEHIALRQTKE